MGEDLPHIDTRYSPIYQRGGTGSPAADARRGTSGGTAANRMPDAPGQPSPSEPANVVELAPEPASQPSAGTPAATRRANPFVMVLWLLGASLLALGFWAVFAPLQVDETTVQGPFPQWVFIISQSAGGIVVGGSILLAAAGALSAVFWDRRHRERNRRGAF